MSLKRIRFSFNNLQKNNKFDQFVNFKMEKCRVVRLVNVEPQKSIIIDTHGGIEDIIGIMSAIQLAKLYDKTILGITCVNGRRNVHDAASDALLAIKLCNANIPIYLGATETIMMKKRFPKTLNQSNKFQFIDKIKHQVLKQQDFKLIQSTMAPRFIAQSAQKYRQFLAIVTFGPLTNIAIAFHVQYSIKEVGMISINGGQYTGVGNVLGEYSAQANFHFDPQAAHIVIKNFSKNVYITPIERTLDICWKKTLLQVAAVACVDEYKTKLLERLAKYQVTCVGPLLAVFPVVFKKSLKKYFDVYAELSMQGRMIQGLLAINWFRLDLKDGEQEPNVKICAEYDTQAMKQQLKKSWCGIRPHEFKV